MKRWRRIILRRLLLNTIQRRLETVFTDGWHQSGCLPLLRLRRRPHLCCNLKMVSFWSGRGINLLPGEKTWLAGVRITAHVFTPFCRGKEELANNWCKLMFGVCERKDFWKSADFRNVPAFKKKAIHLYEKTRFWIHWPFYAGNTCVHFGSTN